MTKNKTNNQNPILNHVSSSDMISDKDLIVNSFISVPKEMGSLNCGAYVAGIVEAMLDGMNFVSDV